MKKWTLIMLSAASFLLLIGCQLNKRTVTISIDSNITGFAYTNNKSTLKETVIKTNGPGDTRLYYFDESGNYLAYPDDTVISGNKVTYTGAAKITLQSNKGIDDSKIDSSQATVSLVDGDGYNINELMLNNTLLSGDWENGSLTYQLSVGDLEWTLGNYTVSDTNSGKEWSCFGGDGNGLYTFNLQVDGLKYDGEKVASQNFQVNVYIYGRDATDMAEQYNDLEAIEAVESKSGKTPGSKVQWTWEGSGDKPNLADNNPDNFYITWAEADDATNLVDDDVSIILTSKYGNSLTLSDEDYHVFNYSGETQIALTYRNWASIPVYTEMTLSASANNHTVSKTYDIASVYINMVQTGGGGRPADGTVTAYSYYGFANLVSVDQVMNKATYTLITDDNRYYAEHENGTGYLTSDESKAKSFDASGETDTNQTLIGNVAVITNRADQIATKTIDGSDRTFTKKYDTSHINKSYQEMAKSGLEAADGYVFPEDSTGSSMWSWQDKFQYGWTSDKGMVNTLPDYAH